MKFNLSIPYVALTAFVTSFSPSSAIAQSCDFSLGTDTAACFGESVTLYGPPDALSIVWQNGLTSLSIQADTAGTYWCSGIFPEIGANLVQNGNFSQGDVGFTTDFIPGTGGGFGLLSAEGTYAVTPDASSAHTAFYACGDHTGGGQMLVVNGSPDPDANIWSQTIAVVPNTNYAFSAWLASATPYFPAEMDFLVNGVSLGTPLLASANTCEWDQYYAVWNSGSSTAATISIINQQLASTGNDFALDDISFSTMCGFTDSINVTMLPPAPVIDLGPDAAICPGTSVALTPQFVPANWPYTSLTYTWNTGAHTPSVNAFQPGMYTVTVEGPCVAATASVTFIEDTCATLLRMPNVFSPNGDGVNDGFGPILTGDPVDFSMLIHNRWGQLVYSTTYAKSRWDGRVEGDLVPAGTYFWVVQYGSRMDDGSIVRDTKTGAVTLMGNP